VEVRKRLRRHVYHRLLAPLDDRFQNLESFNMAESSPPAKLSIKSEAVHVLHHHVDNAVRGCAQIIDGYCIRMTKTPSGLTFAPKPAQPLGVVSNLWRKNLDCHTVAQQNVPGAVHGSHAPFPQHRIDLVLAVEHGAND